MSQDAMAKVIERASTDAGFRAQLKTNPESALAGYNLTADERACLPQVVSINSGIRGNKLQSLYFIIVL